MLKILGVSRSGYRSFFNRKVSPTRQRKNAVKKEIQKIYDNSKQNYGAPKIAQELSVLMLPHLLTLSQKENRAVKRLLCCGSPNWARTSDIMINSHALYRLSYGGI
jgi:hypothetical protein